MKIEIVKHSYGKVVSEVDIFETCDDDAYSTVSKFIEKICQAVEFAGDMIISIGTKYLESDEFDISNQYYDGRVWEYDWWEGEPYIRIYGWCFIDRLRFYPGSGDCWFITNAGRDRRWQKD